MTIRPSKGRDGQKPKSRQLPLPQEVTELLRWQIDQIDGEFVFLPMPNASRIFRNILVAAEIPERDKLGRKATIHSFRHTYSTLVAELLGSNPFVVKEILGHKKLSTTERYCHPTAPNMGPILKGVSSLGFSALGVRVRMLLLSANPNQQRKSLVSD